MFYKLSFVHQYWHVLPTRLFPLHEILLQGDIHGHKAMTHIYLNNDWPQTLLDHVFEIILLQDEMSLEFLLLLWIDLYLFSIIQ